MNPQIGLERSQAKWRERKCPCVEGVLFSDGTIHQVSVEYTGGGLRQLQQRCIMGEWTSIEDVARRDDFWYLDVDELCKLDIPSRGVRASCGDGPEGGDGFVALSRIRDDALLWIALFFYSNEFLELLLEGDSVLTRNNHDNWFRFPLDSPDNCSCVE